MSSEPTAKERSLAELSALAATRRDELHSAVRHCNLELDSMRLINTEVEDAYRQRSANLKLAGNLDGINAALTALDFSEDQDLSFWDGFRGRGEWAGRRKLAETLEDFKSGRGDLIKLLLDMRTEAELLDEFVAKAAQAPSGKGDLEVVNLRLLAAEREREENEAAEEVAKKEADELKWAARKAAINAAWAETKAAWEASEAAREAARAAGTVVPGSGYGLELQVLLDGEKSVEAREGGI